MTERIPNLDSTLRAMRIIAIGLILGVLVLASAALVVVHGGGQPAQPQGQIVSLVMVGIVVAELVPFALVPVMVHAGSPQIQQAVTADSDSSDDESRVHLAVYQTRTILRYALCEGAAFANLIAYMVEHNWWSLAVAGGLVFIMLAMFPSRIRLEHWLETQRMMTH